jgi:ADP-heptose:LPS heptosyltransferase
VLAFTRSADLVAALRAHARRVLHHDPAPPPGSGHAALWLSRPLRDLGVEPLSGPAPVLVFTDEEKEVAGRLAAPLPAGFLAVHPGSGSPAKTWAADDFRELVRALAPERPWLLILGPAEADPPSPLLRLPGALPAPCLGPRFLAAVVARAGLFVGNDSGVSHLAAAAGAPTLALYGPTDPTHWAPLGPKVEVVRSADRTMAGLSLADVLAVAERLTGWAR